MSKLIGELEEPTEEDCCGNGCSPCVFDIYRTRLLSSKQPQRAHTLRTDLLSETCFKPFILLEKLELCEHVYKFRFQPKQLQTDDSDFSGVLPYSLGQHLVLRFYVGVNENLGSIDKHYSSVKDLPKISSEHNNVVTQMITRAYTPVTLAVEENNCCFEIIAKLYNDGLSSCFLRGSQINDAFYWRGPYGDFNYKTNSVQHILMLCIGTGIAPFVPLLKTVLENESEDTVVHLMYGVKNIHQLIMRDQLRGMCQYWNFTLQYFFSQDNDSNNNIKFGESFEHGRIGKYPIQKYFDDKVLEKVLVLVCGSDKFSIEIKNILLELGVNCNTNLHIF